MVDLAGFAVLVLRSAGSLLVAVIILMLLRDIRRHDRALGAIVAGGVLIRAALGALLFWISYLELPVLSSLHSGDGFWQLAPDARLYFTTAAQAVRDGLDQISSSSSSPAFTRLLAVWMWIVGVSPASGPFLNLLLFTTSSWLVVRVFRPASQDGPFALTLLLAAYSYVPAAVLFSVQALKDQLVLALVLCVGAGMWLWTARAASGRRPPREFGIALVLLSVCVIGGIRPYFGALIVLAFAVAAVPQIVRAAGLVNRLRTAASAAAWVVILWIAFAVGSGPYHTAYELIVARAVGLEGYAQMAAAFRAVERARAGFVHSGGETNIAGDESADEDAVGGPLKPGRTVRRLAVGLAVTFVPIHVVQWSGEVSLRGGRGLLLVTDVDTAAVLLVTVLGFGYVLRRDTTEEIKLSFVVFCAVLATTTILLMAYVVTNYGTLFRLRLFPFLVLWMIPLAVSSTRSAAASRSDHFMRSGMSVPVPHAREN